MLNEETFAIMVLMAIVTTFITTPAVMAVYKPARHYNQQDKSGKLSCASSSSSFFKDPKELRVLACVHGHRDVPSIINLVETIRGGTKKSPVKLYILHLVELTERSSSIIMAHRESRNGIPFNNPRRASRDQIGLAFQAYGSLGRVRVRPMTAVSAMPTMHEDVCNVAENKRAALVVMPFHKHRAAGEDAGMENAGPVWRAVNQRVLKEATCTVSVLVDRGFGGERQVGPAEVAHGVCVVFFGGPDDREALELAGRMAEHPGVTVTAVRFVTDGEPAVKLRPSLLKSTEKRYTFSTAVDGMDHEREKELDDAAVEEFTRRTEGAVRYEERLARNVVEAVLGLGRSKEYELIVVGKGRFPSAMVAELAGRTAEHAELGPIGDALASSNNGVVCSVLVVQQHDVVHSEETPVSLVMHGDDVAVDAHSGEHEVTSGQS